MPSKHLQIEVDLTPHGMPQIGKFTPVDVAIPDNVAVELQKAIDVGDMGDLIPGDHQLEMSNTVNVKIKLWFTTVNEPVDVEGIMRIVTKP